MVESGYNNDTKSHEFWPSGFPQFTLWVPDDGKGIYLGNSVVDAVVARDMAKALEAAAAAFDKVHVPATKSPLRFGYRQNEQHRK